MLHDSHMSCCAVSCHSIGDLLGNPEGFHDVLSNGPTSVVLPSFATFDDPLRYTDIVSFYDRRPLPCHGSPRLGQ